MYTPWLRFPAIKEVGVRDDTCCLIIVGETRCDGRRGLVGCPKDVYRIDVQIPSNLSPSKTFDVLRLAFERLCSDASRGIVRYKEGEKFRPEIIVADDNQ